MLSVAESEAVCRATEPSMIVPGRFVYGGKSAPLGADEHQLPVKASAQFCVRGHFGPRLAMGDLRADAQFTEILSGVFGLAAAPRQWWAKLRRALLAAELPLGSFALRLLRHPLGPALCCGFDQSGEPRAVAVARAGDSPTGVSDHIRRFTTSSTGHCHGVLGAACILHSATKWRGETGAAR